ncbi:hypothetical protein RF11_03513 [Thelohanellus kitauei]|uniref:Uncharacterized protein n=1 Tax=Thelohanellus kitauei TaxID=669202 RepID=A0A0C2NB29_THEKT|nr:hypothetical protein RF11_03513 [Thelohanellus kitauei]
MSKYYYKKPKYVQESRQFKEEWTNNYLMYNLIQTDMFLIGSRSVKVLKELNCRRHYETKPNSFSYANGKITCVWQEQAVCVELCLKNSNLFDKIRLSGSTIQPRSETYQRTYFNSCLKNLFISIENVDTTQLFVFVRAVNEGFNINQELAGMTPLHGRTCGEDIIRG